MAKNDSKSGASADGTTAGSSAGAAPKGMSPAELEVIRQQIAKSSENMSERTDDVAGYWVPDVLPINCVPRSVKMFDSGIDPTKPSMLIAAELLAPTMIADSDKEQRLAKKGEVVGIWFKPGMRGIRSCGNVATFIEDTKKTKNVGKGNDMKLYMVKSAPGGVTIPIAEDSRQKSKHVSTPFDVVQSSVAQGPDQDSDVPF